MSHDWQDDQLTLIDIKPRARATDPWTSRAAAASITAGSSEGRILDVLRFGPLTDEELGEALFPSLPATISTARSRLSKTNPPLVVAVGSKLNSRRREVLIWGLA